MKDSNLSNGCQEEDVEWERKAAFVRDSRRRPPKRWWRSVRRRASRWKNYVYAIRSRSSGAKAQTAGKSRPTARGKGRQGTAASNGMSAAEAQLRDAIADLGLVKAGEILAGVKATIRGR